MIAFSIRCCKVTGSMQPCSEYSTFEIDAALVLPKVLAHFLCLSFSFSMVILCVCCVESKHLLLLECAENL